MFDLKDIYIDTDDPWLGILAATCFTVLCIYHTKLKAIPAQLVFGHDMILNTPSIADWKYIRLRKQK